jgi:HTH-type transcriptional regulator / antitoxin HigA
MDHQENRTPRGARVKVNVRAIQSAWKNLNTLGVHLRPIIGDRDHKRMVQLLDVLLDDVGDDEDHPLSGLLHLVGDIIDRYEREHFPMEAAEPREVLRELMDGRGIKQTDLAGIVAQSAWPVDSRSSLE